MLQVVLHGVATLKGWQCLRGHFESSLEDGSGALEQVKKSYRPSGPELDEDSNAYSRLHV